MMLYEIELAETESRTGVGRRLKEARDFEQLSHLLLLYTCKRLSPTTLKRFWGYLKNEEVQTRLHTLDVLARFVGLPFMADRRQGSKSLNTRERPDYYI